MVPTPHLRTSCSLSVNDSAYLPLLVHGFILHVHIRNNKLQKCYMGYQAKCNALHKHIHFTILYACLRINALIAVCFPTKF